MRQPLDRSFKPHPAARAFRDNTSLHEVARKTLSRAERIVHAIAVDAIDPNVSDQIVIAQATDTSYCTQITDGQTTWSERGPDGAPRPHACA
jgi:hypothetical protein